MRGVTRWLPLQAVCLQAYVSLWFDVKLPTLCAQVSFCDSFESVNSV